MTQVSKKFVEAFVKKYGVKPSTLSALGYDAYMLIVSAIERAKTTKPELIATAIRSIKNFQGATGAISIDKEGNAQKEIVILKVKNGDFVYSGKLNTNVLK